MSIHQEIPVTDEANLIFREVLELQQVLSHGYENHPIHRTTFAPKAQDTALLDMVELSFRTLPSGLLVKRGYLLGLHIIPLGGPEEFTP